MPSIEQAIYMQKPQGRARPQASRTPNLVSGACPRQITQGLFGSSLLPALHLYWTPSTGKPVLVAMAVVCAMCRKAASNLLSDPQICNVLRSVWFAEPTASESMPGIVGRSRVKGAEEC